MPEKKALLAAKVMTGGKTVVWCYAPGLSDGKSLDPARVKEYAGVPYATPGISTTKMDGWTSVYARDYKLYTAESLRGVIAAAGALMWASKPCVVFANERFLAVHTKDGGEIMLSLPRRASKVVDLISGETIATDADRFSCKFSAPDTRLFDFGSTDMKSQSNH